MRQGRPSTRDVYKRQLLGFAQAFHVEERLLETVKSNPDGVFWDFLKVIPQGVPPGQEELLEDDDEEAGGWKKH